MPLPPEYQELLVKRRTEEEKAAKHETRVELAKTFGYIALWTVIGLAFIGLSWHVTDVGYGWIFWWSGALFWVAGVWVTVMAAYQRGVKRGDWE